MGSHISVFDYNDTSGTNVRLDWMSRLDDGRSIASVSIPGTNRSASRSSSTVLPNNIFHVWDIPKQLESGVRFLDIRWQRERQALRLCNNAQRDTTTKDAVDTCVHFLRQHPTEFIVMVMRVSAAYVPDDEDNLAFEAYLNQLFQPAQLFWRNPDIPTVAEARGKVVIMNDTNEAGIFMGIPYSNLPQGGSVPVVHDSWSATDIPLKWPGIEAHLQLAISAERNLEVIYITYTSGSSENVFPVTVADGINVRLSALLGAFPSNRTWGYVVMDFPGLALIHGIIDSNFNDLN